MPSDAPSSPADKAALLKGVTIVELGHSVAAPFAGLVFAELGAKVVKVEMPGRGDHTRDWGPPYREGTAVLYQVYNRDKESIVVDLADPAQSKALKRYILENADAVIQNLRPGVTEKYGIDAATLRREKPALIYCNLTAFGPTGPLMQRPGYDPLMQAFGGVMSVTGEEGRAPVRVGTSIVDMGAGMWSVIGIIAALYARTSSGQGCSVDTSLYETAITWMSPVYGPYLASGETPKRWGSGAAQIVPYEAFQTADGYLMIAAGSDGLFRRLSAALGAAEWAEDERFATNGARVINRSALIPMIAAVVKENTSAFWADKLNEAQVPNAPIQTADQVLSHPQTEALGIVQNGPDDDFPLIGLPVTFDGERPQFRRKAPKLGEHTEDVLSSYFKEGAE